MNRYIHTNFHLLCNNYFKKFVLRIIMTEVQASRMIADCIKIVFQSSPICIYAIKVNKW